MGKSIDKRLAELGGERVLPLMCADEATGLEENVEKWRTSTLSYLEKLYLSDSNALSHDADVETKNEQVEALRRVVQQRSMTKHSCSIDVLGYHLSTVPEGLKPASYFVDLLHLQDFISAQSLEMDSKARTQRRQPCSHELTAQIVQDEGVFEAKGIEEAPAHWSMVQPFHAKVVNARWLTNPEKSRESLYEGVPGRYDWGEAKRVVHCSLSLEGSGIQYSPGDSLAVCCPNPPYAVKLMLRRLQQVHHEDNLQLETRILLSGAKTSETLGDLLSYRFDLTSVPKKATIKALANYCHADNERQLLLALGGREVGAKQLWNMFIEQQRLGIAELLWLVPSCLPTMSQLFSALCPQVPRYYSIASSPLTDPQSVAFAFSAVRYTCEVTSPEGVVLHSVRRSGVCTLHLEHALRGFLHPECNAVPEEGVTMRVFHKPTHCFHLPGNVGLPLILVGPGTGVAPFMSFLSHRACLQHRKRSGDIMSTGLWRGGFELDEMDLPFEGSCVDRFMQSVCPGSISLFYGCRNEDDFLFEAELAGFVRENVLQTLEVAMSRKYEDKLYVTHKLQARGKEVAHLILTQGASVYICGDGNKMAKDVTAALKHILAQHGDMTEEAAAQYVAEMQQRHKLLLDIWSA